MKSLILSLLVALLFLCCYDSEYDYVENQDDCTRYTDLCGDGGYDSYYICCNNYDCWYEVNGKEYYTVEYMWGQECY